MMYNLNYHTEIRSNPGKYELNTVRSTETLEIMKLHGNSSDGYFIVKKS